MASACPPARPRDFFRWLEQGECLASEHPMKNFFTSFFASLTALIVFIIGACLMGFLLIGALIALSQKKPVAVEEGSYLVFDLSTSIVDTPEQNEGFDDFME